MYHPSFEEFRKLARTEGTVLVHRQLLADTLTPVSAFLRLSEGARYAFLLESASGGETVGRFSFVGADPLQVFASRGNDVQLLHSSGEKEEWTGEPFAQLKQVLSRFSCKEPEHPDMFTGGAVGYISYDAVRHIEDLPNLKPDILGLPELYFGIYDTLVVFDHLHKVVRVSCMVRTDEASAASAYELALDKIDSAVERLRHPIALVSDDVQVSGPLDLAYSSNFRKVDFEDAVRRAKEYILAGDVFQVVPSQRLVVTTSVDGLAIYRTLRVVNPSPYMFYLRMPDVSLIGASPEVMVKVENGTVTLRPIAGTRKRGETIAEDKALEKELLADEKERAEHIMLVDLARNDVGKVCDFASVKLDEFMTVERYSHVMHLTSNVSGKLRRECDAFDALRASIPAGTVTGAPKVRAMEIIEELEPEKRGPYAGAVGMHGFGGDLNTCITIRTITLVGDIAYVQAGAGIVADSVPEREYEETLNKAKALLKAIEIAERQLGAINV